MVYPCKEIQRVLSLFGRYNVRLVDICLSKLYILYKAASETIYEQMARGRNKGVKNEIKERERERERERETERERERENHLSCYALLSINDLRFSISNENSIMPIISPFT